MKKIKLEPLKIDVKTLAKLDRDQLEKMKGGFKLATTKPANTSCTGTFSCVGGDSCLAPADFDPTSITDFTI